MKWGWAASLSPFSLVGLSLSWCFPLSFARLTGVPFLTTCQQYYTGYTFRSAGPKDTKHSTLVLLKKSNALVVCRTARLSTLRQRDRGGSWGVAASQEMLEATNTLRTTATRICCHRHRFVGRPLEETECWSYQERLIIPTALFSIHRHGFVHKNIHKENILTQRNGGLDDDGVLQLSKPQHAQFRAASQGHEATDRLLLDRGAQINAASSLDVLRGTGPQRRATRPPISLLVVNCILVQQKGR